MEDAHVVESLGDGNILFGIFDGHGGSEVAKYVSKNIAKTLLADQCYKKHDFKNALINTYIKLDRLLMTE